MRRTATFLAALTMILGALTASQGAAADLFGGVFAHDVNLGISICCYEHGADIMAGARTGPILSLQGFGQGFGDLRAYAFGSVNTSGGVDFGAAGLAWRLHLTPRIYIQPALGAAVQDGDADDYQRRPDHLDLGSRFLFEPELSLGWRIAPQWAAEIAYVHLSHAQLAGPQNPGMDDLGLRLIYRLR